MVGLKPYHFFKKEVINIFKNKHLKITICLILIFTISINFMFYQKVQAVGITAGLAIKAMAVILSSMGVLHVVQNNGGIQSFFDEFTLFNHEGLNALRDMAINNIVHNVKIKANNVIASIREFFNSWAQEELVDPWEIGDGVFFADTITASGTFREMSSSNSGRKVIYNDGNNIVEVVAYVNEANTAYFEVRFIIYFNGQSVHFFESGRLGETRNTHNGTWSIQYQIKGDSIKLNYSVMNFTRNEIFTDNIIFDKSLYFIHYLEGLNYLDPTFEIPQPQSLPRNGVDIAWDEATNKSISYLPGETKLEKLIEDIANASVETFVEKYTSWGKATTDSLTGPIISTETRVNQETGVEEQVVTDVTETVFDDIYEETQTQTGLLGSILGAITDLKDFVKSIFIPEEFNSLDFSPLQNIGLSEKFPFSLPWDIKNSVIALSSNPEAPIFDVPIVTEEITIDFAEFESWASIIRVFTTLIFVIALIILTRRLI